MHSSSLILLGIAFAAAASSRTIAVQPDVSGTVPAEQVMVLAPVGTQRPPFQFTKDDQQFLTEVQRGAFNYLWNQVAPKTGMVRDRTSGTVVSVAGVGFQLSALPVGVERGWVTRDDAQARAKLILSSLAANPANRKAGLFYHYLDGELAGPTNESYERAVSTIDSALLFAGIITASSYFGGDIRDLGDKLLADADWTFFVATDDARIHKGPPRDYERGFISLAWTPDVQERPTGDGKLAPYYWVDSGDEHRLVAFLAVCAPNPAHRLAPETYYRLRRELGSYRDTGVFAWFPYSGALFTYFFAHCWIDYGSLGPDNPGALGVANRPRVDWWENSRRAVRMHQLKAIENPARVPTLGENAWGLTASDSPKGYAVPGLYPTRIPTLGERPGFDYAVFNAKDDYGDGTVAPYGAGCAILFDPTRAVAALRYYRDLKRADGTSLVWQDPASGGIGFRDAFNLGTEWSAPDCVAIDQGPLILAIENARTGLVWKLFQDHPTIRGGMTRLGLGQRP